MTDQTLGDARAEAEAILAQTPATLPLKRPAPVFAEAQLPAETSPNDSVAPQNDSVAEPAAAESAPARPDAE